ncbi:hypothetical protein LYSHEL_09710 [Lysobacter helvus]|uniref:histidine kinase n=2 Tax=Lysobacteraceae TaxID=32033 RepID=A0ABN6FQN0_9GAMM|nr:MULTISPECIES: ATP-binding protein [Lysobacter]BCT91947.1 hypothetical protein LYSCAS_09710 [Lysobacter caseinilyticus]BCT95100.1 hypothetical protein LYSHEL_09710 [Lysobacter helvus]
MTLPSAPVPAPDDGRTPDTPAPSERWLEIGDRADIGLLRTDAHGRIVDVNTAAARLLGRGIETLRGVDLSHLVEDDARPAVTSALHDLRLRHGPIALDVRLARVQGATARMLMRLSPVRDTAGVLRASTVVLLELDERAPLVHGGDTEQAIASLRASEERCRSLFATIDQGFCVIEVLFDGDRAVDYRFLETNAAFERHTGLRDAVGKRMRELAPSHEEHWFELYGRVARTGQPVREVLPARELDDRMYEVHAFPYGAPGSNRVAVMFDDITLRTRTEHALRVSEERFRYVANATPSILWSASADGELTWLSDRWLEYTGLPVRVDRDSRNGAIHPADRHLAAEAWARAHAGADFDVELRLRRRDGAYRWFLVRAKAMRDDDGQVTAWYGSTTDIHDHKLAEVALRDVDRRKDEFLATLAHELRNPLAPLRNCLHILRMADEGDGAAVDSERLHAVMERQVAQLVRLVDDLMEVSRITRGMVPLHLQAVTIQDVVERAVETSRPLLDAAHHTLDIDMPTLPLPLRADPVRLAQVLSNLLNNAAKYTNPGGHIVLSATRQDADVVLRVRDNGLGIEPDELDRVFDLFNQAEHSIGHAAGGLGIGLTLVRSLVELHGGTVLARSGGLGQGSEFEVRLPLHDGDAVDFSDDEVSGGPMGAAHQRLRLLVVDDNREHTDSLALYLRMTGHTVRTAYDAASALVWQGTFSPDAVLLDLGLPGVDGLEVCRRMRAAGGEALVIVAITGRGQASDRQRSAEAGFDAHLVKPVDPAALVTLVDSLLRIQRREA